MIKKILIANRGEIAVRIIRTCREMGIATVAVYSEADKDALYVKLADETVCIGPPSPKDSYLNIPNILSACILTNSDAIHPGFGFLSENSDFARMCDECGIKFIGPNARSISLMGNKAEARRIMKKSGVPVVEGFEGKLENGNDALIEAEKIGFPIMIKAAAGGGGKGIRIVYSKDDFISNFETAKSEANANFGDDTMYIERYVEKPKHIEIQIICDKHGNGVYLGERDCSIQRKNQKVLEEAPSTVLDENKRKEMGEIALRAAKAAGYDSVGTIEFLYDKNGNYYFMEMNTRIQVEHPVSEMITGIDIVKEMILVEDGEKLSFTQDDIKLNGHAIECRVNAEDPEHGFRPCPGTISEVNFPGGLGVRVDSSIYSGYSIPPYYDSMVAKLIVHGNTRDEAISRMRRALYEFAVVGVITNIDYQFSILNDKRFIEGKYDTSFLSNL